MARGTDADSRRQQARAAPHQIGSAGPTEPRPPVEVELLHRSSLNFAMEQNGVPLVQHVGIRHNTSEVIRGARLHLQLVPDLGDQLIVDLPPIAPETFKEFWKTRKRGNSQVPSPRGAE